MSTVPAPRTGTLVDGEGQEPAATTDAPTPFDAGYAPQPPAADATPPASAPIASPDVASPSLTTQKLAAQPTVAPAKARKVVISRKATIDDIAADDEHTSDATLDDIHKSLHTAQDADLDTRREGPEGELDAKIRAHLDSVERKKPEPLIGTTVAGRFQVLKKIGAGGMGAVYRARQEGMDRDVAVKVLLSDLVDNDMVLRRFTLEALAVSRLRHPNTIQIYDFGQTEQGNSYIAMELLEGLTVHDLLCKERPLAIRRALRIIAQVAESLAEAHGKGIVHRDLKPENIFLVTVGDNPDYVKVLDFGVAKLRDAKSDGKGTLTQAGSIFGTPRYMSPEQCSAQPVDGRSDLYSLGVILYEMVTGRAPFVHDQPLSLLLAHVNDPPPPPSKATDKQVIPAEVESLVLKLLSKKADDRVQQAAELALACRELERALPAAFDLRVGTEEEAAALGVRVAQAATLEMPTSRTMRVPGEGDTSAVPTLVPPGMAPSHRRLLLPLMGVGAVGVAAVLYAVFALQQPPALPQIIEKVVERTVTLAPDMVEITLSSVPAGAFVLYQGLNIGTTNARLQHKKGAPPETWQLVRDGYETTKITVDFAESRAFEVKLVRLAADAPKPAPVVEVPKPQQKVVRPKIDRPEPPKPVEAQKPVEVQKPIEPPKPVDKPKPKKEEGVDELQ
jgi:tRNA A-37 threonylcarbamoyl transferase component Bud32